MIPGEFRGSTNLPESQTFYINKAAKVLMIGEDENFVQANF